MMLVSQEGMEGAEGTEDLPAGEGWDLGGSFTRTRKRYLAWSARQACP